MTFCNLPMQAGVECDEHIQTSFMSLSLCGGGGGGGANLVR
jgi:hypothetical protein